MGILRAEVEEKNRQLQTLLNGLVSENMDLKARVQNLESSAEASTARIRELEERLGEVERLTKMSVYELRRLVLERRGRERVNP